MTEFAHRLVSSVRWRWTEFNGEAILQALVITPIVNPKPDYLAAVSRADVDEIAKDARAYLKSVGQGHLIIEIL